MPIRSCISIEDVYNYVITTCRKISESKNDTTKILQLVTMWIQSDMPTNKLNTLFVTVVL